MTNHYLPFSDLSLSFLVLSGFPCCWGTLSESFAKLGDSIFFWQPAGREAVYINQFVSATATLRPAGKVVSLKQVTACVTVFP